MSGNRKSKAQTFPEPPAVFPEVGRRLWVASLDVFRQFDVEPEEWRLRYWCSFFSSICASAARAYRAGTDPLRGASGGDLRAWAPALVDSERFLCRGDQQLRRALVELRQRVIQEELRPLINRAGV